MSIYELIHAFDPQFMFLVNLYWLLFLIPGYAFWRYLKSKEMYHKDDGLTAGFVFSFFYSALLLLPFNFLQFFFTIPSILVLIYSFTFIGIGLFYLIKASDFMLRPRATWKEIKKRKSGLGILLTALFGGYFLLGQIIKAFALFEFDAWMHISKINFMINNGLSNLDPYLIEPGKQIIQSSFFSNLVHTIFIVPSKLLGPVGVGTPFIWYYSISIFSLFSYGVVYFFTKRITENKDLSVFITLLYFFTTFATQNQWLAQYPTRVAFLFSLITLTFLKDYLWDDYKKIVSVPFIGFVIGVLAISFLHQIMASLMVLFVIGLSFISWCFKEVRLRDFALIAITSLVAIPTSLYTKLQSKFLPTAVYKLADSDDWIIRLSSKFSMTKYPDQALTAVILISILGVLAVIYLVKEKKNRLFLLYSIVFTNLLLYSPVFGVVNKFIPTWGIVRIDYYVVVIYWILAGSSIWAIADLIFRHSKTDGITKIWGLATIILLLSLPAQKDLKLFYDVSSWNQGSYLYVKELTKWSEMIRPHSIILTDKSLSFSIPGIYNAYSATLDNERTTDSIDTTERATELNDFFYNKQRSVDKKRELIQKYGVSYLIVRKKDQESFKDFDAENIGFKLADTLADYKLYEKK